MNIIEVTTPEQAKEFLLLPVRMYRQDPNYVRPLDKDIEEIFDPKKNKLFREGNAKRWLLQDGQGRAIGKVAAFYNRKQCRVGNQQPTGGMGFFDCIDDQQAANMLFDTCRDWLKEQGMEAMDGPVNFGDRDKWWGCLVEGFTLPNYCMPYHAPYYGRLFEQYGFGLYFKQYTYHRPVQGRELAPQVYAKAERLMKDPSYSFRHLEVKHMDKYAMDFCTVYNKAWVKHEGVSAMAPAMAKKLFATLRPIVDEQLAWFAYYKDEPIGFYLQLPNLNQAVRHLDGKLDWWGKLKMLYYLRFSKEVDRIFGLVFGVAPRFQGKGVESAMVVAFQKVAWVKNFKYTDLEMNWIGDFNPSMMHVAENVGGQINKVHHTYRYMFDPSKPVERMHIIGERVPKK